MEKLVKDSETKNDVYDILKILATDGVVSNPRESKVLEVMYFQGVITNPWSFFEARKYPLDYFKRELQWYLKADPKDQSICEHATMWGKLVQNSGSIFSNYGYYWFNAMSSPHRTPGFEWVVESIQRDRDTRQAYIPMLSTDHIFEGNKDVVCTKGIQFRVIENKLVMHVSMRSSDVIYGMGTDLPCFDALHQMVSLATGYDKGDFIFSADSIHVYERHFKMVSDILKEGRPEAVPYVPEITDYEDLLDLKFESEYGQWLTQAKL